MVLLCSWMAVQLLLQAVQVLPLPPQVLPLPPQVLPLPPQVLQAGLLRILQQLHGGLCRVSGSFTLVPPSGDLRARSILKSTGSLIASSGQGQPEV